MQPLNPLTLPLHGHHLLEASAGTGKTYTLALLFLRLLVERGLSVDQILVVTFTRAATGELRDRIRQRLRQALTLCEERAPTEDPLMTAVLATVPAPLARQRLTDALARMDEAAIQTIHGFCQCALKDHAFESGQPFEVEWLENEGSLKLQVMEDFWRTRFYPLSPAEAAWVTRMWQEPAGLLKALGQAATSLDCELIPQVEAEAVDGLRQETSQWLAQVQAVWPQVREEVRRLLTDEHSGLKRNEAAYRLTDRVPELLAGMDHLVTATELPLLLPQRIENLTPAVMAGHLKKNSLLPQHPFFDLFARFHRSHESLVKALRIHTLLTARDYLLSELDLRKRQQGLLSSDDLLTRLDAALAAPGAGTLLAARLLARSPAALVDEFQDTDPVQYRLFSRIYPPGAGALFLIGDPKQAIYAFRGADIFTYIRARRKTPEAARHTLRVNYRATTAMVGAVNTLFGLRPDAFIFTQDIAFQPVEAAGQTEQLILRLNGQPLPPFNALLLEDPDAHNPKTGLLSKETASRAAAAHCAEAIVRLLEAPARPGEPPLTPGDIAILVRSNRQAEAMHKGLRFRGVHSVATGQRSVFATAQARHLNTLLTSLSNLADTARTRACLATPLFGRTAEELQALAEDEAAWARQLESLLHYQHLWRSQGFFSMFQHLLAGQQVTRRLSADSEGERALTNYLHLAELLRESPASQHGLTALVRWLQQQIARPDDQAEDQLIRLENDEHLIRIITLHKAKGLEFPVVFLPFLWHLPEAGKNQPLSFHHREQLHLTVDLEGEEEQHRLWACEEQLAEELRLLYVAVTRAKYGCFFCWGRISKMERTGLAHLLHQGRMPENEAVLSEELGQLNVHEPVLGLHTLARTLGSQPLKTGAPVAVLPPRPFLGRVNPGWTLTSYSRLIANTDHPPGGEEGEGSVRLAPEAEDFTSVFTFPRGPAAGTCLHNLLERLDFNQPVGEQGVMIESTLAQAGIDPRWQPTTERWLGEIIAAPLPEAQALRQIPAADRVNELSFLFPLEQVQLGRFNALLQAAGLRPLEAQASSLQGLMKGFIDLVFRHQGRYFLVDYKSNHLGGHQSHYGPEALATCMDSHQYPLQALIYTLALHRFLGSRLPDYSYERHFGGVRYLFLRALHPDYPPGTGIHASRPDEGLITALDNCCRGGR